MKNKTSSSFLSRIIYKKDRVGVVVKDGKTYVKYTKARRFKISTNVKCVIFSVFMLFVLGLSLKMLMSVLNSAQSAVEEELITR